MGENIIFTIGANEEIASVIDRLKKESCNSLEMVIPKNALILRSIINLKLLKKQIDKEGKKVIVSLEDEKEELLATRAGLTVASKKRGGAVEDDIIEDEPDEAVSMPVRRAIQEPQGIKANTAGVDSISRRPSLRRKSIFDTNKLFKKNNKNFEEQKDFLSKYNLNNKRSNMDSQQKNSSSGLGFGFKLFFFFLLSSLVLAAIVIFLVLPTVDIKIKTKAEELSANIQVVVDAGVEEVDLSTYRVPGYLVETTIEESQEFSATGEKEISEKAKGTITVYNEWSSQSQTLVETTRFLSENGKLFRTTKTVVVPGANVLGGKTVPGTAVVELEADVAGEEYNIAASDFTIPGFEGTVKYSTIYGKSTTAMTGGATKKATVMSADDYTKAKQTLTDICLDKASTKLKEVLEERKIASDNISDDLKLLNFAIKEQIVNESSSLKIEEEGEKFTFTLKVKAQGIVFDENNLKIMVNDYFASSLPEEKEIIENSGKVSYPNEAKSVDFTNGKMVFDINAEEQVMWRIDEDHLRSMIAGKTGDELKVFFMDMSEIENVEVSFWPFWVKKVPASSEKINISFSY